MKIHLLVKPNAKETKALGLVDGVYSIALRAQPKDGEANDELVRFLSKTLGIAKTLIVVSKGTTSKHKTIEIPDGVDLAPLKP